MSEHFKLFPPRISETARIYGKDIHIGPFTVLENYVLLDGGATSSSKIVIGLRCKIKHGAVLRSYDGHITIGDRVSIGEHSIIAGHGGVEIGNFSIIAGHCYITAADHIFLDGEMTRFCGERALGIVIEENVWLGAGCIVLDGVKIGAGTIVGAGSVVTESVPPNCICYGVPCKPVRRRTERVWDGRPGD